MKRIAAIGTSLAPGGGRLDPTGLAMQPHDLALVGGTLVDLAHPFTRHPGGFVNREGQVHPIVREALARGLKVDVGHGSRFSYRMARIALEAGIVPDTLGADMHGYNSHVPPSVALAGTPVEHSDKEHMSKSSARWRSATRPT